MKLKLGAGEGSWRRGLSGHSRAARQGGSGGIDTLSFFSSHLLCPVGASHWLYPTGSLRDRSIDMANEGQFPGTQSRTKREENGLAWPNREPQHNSRGHFL